VSVAVRSANVVLMGALSGCPTEEAWREVISARVLPKTVVNCRRSRSTGACMEGRRTMNVQQRGLCGEQGWSRERGGDLLGEAGQHTLFCLRFCRLWNRALVVDDPVQAGGFMTRIRCHRDD
jgi:hypothetical protein